MTNEKSTKIDIETIILQNLKQDDNYSKRVLPFLKEEYFSSDETKTVFNLINDYQTKYNALPTKESLIITADDLQKSEDSMKRIYKTIDIVSDNITPQNQEWLLKETEVFCQNKSLYNALSESIQIADGELENISKSAIPDILQKALSISFDTDIGHDYLQDAKARFEFFNRSVQKIPFHIDILNKITQGGVEYKTINVVAAATGGGKSIFLCDLAANYMRQGLNVLYITLELAEEKVAQRIDANMLDIKIGDIKGLNESTFTNKMNVIKSKTSGRLMIKEYPTGSAHVGHFKFLLQEYKTKQDFVPNVIMIDYLNLCASSRMKDKSNSYGYVKAIAEELRGLAVETNTCIWSATQLNRQGYDTSEITISQISESMGGPHTFDFLLGITQPEELEKLGQILFKQLKTRYGDIGYYNKFNTGLDKEKMRFYELQNPTTSFSITPNANTQSITKPTLPNNSNPFSNIKE